MATNFPLALDSGAKYTGEQLTNTGSFKIEMKIDRIDIEQEIMCGTFRIHNLTDRYDILCTYFESEMVGNLYPFLTDSDSPDLVHWGMFPEWRPEYVERRKVYDIEKSDFLYLRIKELFLLPDPNIKSVPGASIDGYYYCCYYKKLDCFAGHYYYKNTSNQISQQILLERVEEKTTEEASFI